MYRLGIDLGGTNIVAGIVDENFKIISTAKRKTNCPRPCEDIVDDIAKTAIEAIENAGITVDDISAAGIGAPGDIDVKNGVILLADNLNFVNVPIVAMLKERMGIDFNIQNDANAAAWGEAIAGAAKGTSSSVMITLGTGVGGGIIIDNKVYSGFNFAGAELGHIVIEHDGLPCSCGRKGCWEAYSSATGLINMTKKKIDECNAAGIPTLMNDIAAEKGKVSGVTAFKAMRAGDKAGTEVVDKYIKYLACGLINIINIFQPQVVSLGGGVSGEGQALIDMLLPLIRAEVYGQGVVPATEIRIAQLGNDAGIVGAATLGM